MAEESEVFSFVIQHMAKKKGIGKDSYLKFLSESYKYCHFNSDL